MESHLHRRFETDPRVSESSQPGAASGAGGSQPSDMAWPVLLRVPDLNQPVSQPVKPVEPIASVQPAAINPVPSSALYESHQPAAASTHVDQGVAEKPVDSPAQEKTWRTDRKHETFRPEKYNSNLTTKLVAGTLSLGAVVLVYFALFGGGSGANPDAEDDWKVAEIEEKWTDDQGELEVDLGSEAEIGESSPLAPPFAQQNPPRPREQEPLPTVARMSAEESRSPVTPANPNLPVGMPAETPQPSESSLSGVLPWRQQEFTPGGQFQPPADTGMGHRETSAPAETDYQLNAPLTQAVPTQPYNNQPYPATDTPQAGQYPSTGYQETTYPARPAPAADYPQPGASQADIVSDNQQPAAYQAQNPYPQTGASQPWNTTGGSHAGGAYPATSAPPPAYAPAAGSAYPPTNNTETPREWRR